MSSQGLESGHGPGSCGLGGCPYHGHGSDAANLPIRANTMPTFSRRHAVRAALGGAMAAMISGVGTELAGSRSASAQSTMSPDDALKALMDGNRRFVERRLTSFQEDIDMLMQHTAEKQEPFASVLACADSRVPVELVFDQSIGHVFVNRVAGNIATSEIIASVEYGAAVLGTSLFMVLGHGNCGAIKATIAAKRCRDRSAPFTAIYGRR
jgi:carbonic anhydrase